MLKAQIFNIQTMSTEDGPGIRTSVFFKGCPLKCVWCQNPEGLSREVHLVHEPMRCIGCGTCAKECPGNVISFSENGLTFAANCRKCLTCSEVCPAGAIRVIGTDYTLQELRSKLLQDKPFYENSGGGVTFTGGECLIQHEFIRAITKEMKNAGVHVCIDTSGHVKPEIFRQAVKDADLILYDFKTMDDTLHKQHTGVSNRVILDNARWLGSAGIPVWIRIPVIPGYTASSGNIGAIADFIKENMSRVVERIDLLGYNDLCFNDYQKMGMDYGLDDSPRVKESEMLEYRDLLQKTGITEISFSNYQKGD